MIFQIPYNGVDVSLQIKDPVFGDTQAIAGSTVKHNTIGGSVKIYRKSNHERRLVYNFENIGHEKIREVFDLIETYSEQKWAFADSEGVEWVGTLENTRINARINKRASPCLGTLVRCERGEFTLIFLAVKKPGAIVSDDTTAFSDAYSTGFQ